MAARASGISHPRLETSALVLGPVLVRLSTGVGGDPFGILWVAPLWPFILSRLVVGPLLGAVRARQRPGGRLLPFAYAGVLSVAFVAWAVQSDDLQDAVVIGIRLATVVLLPIAAFAAGGTPHDDRRRLWALLAAIPAFIAINLLLHVLGVDGSAATGRAVMLQAVGITATRTLFPLASGVNNFGGLAGAGLVFGLLLMFARPNAFRGAFLVGSIAAAVSMAAVLMTDNRGALLFAVVTVGLVMLFRALWATRFATVAALAPLVALPFLSFLALAPASLPSEFSRNEFEEQTLNNRIHIWRISFDHVGGSFGSWLFGHGLNGQVASGAGVAIAPFFSPADPLRYEHTAHSLVLQALLDFGLVGALVLFALVAKTLHGLLAHGQDTAKVMAGALLLYFVLAGTTEAHLMPEITDTYAFAVPLLLAGALCPTPLPARQQKGPHTTQRSMEA